MKIKTLLSALIYLLITVPINTFSSQISTGKNIDYRTDKFSMSAALGDLGGESDEYVYDEVGEQLSLLNWKIKQATIIKGEINYNVLSWLTANVNGWNTLDKGRAMMDDYDWLNPYQTDWSDWSHHTNTDLGFANDIDLNLRAWFLQNNNYKLGVVGGYERSAFSFLAKGGCFQYNNSEFTGCFPRNEPGIGYKQIFETSYAGLAGKYLLNDFEFNAIVKFSPTVLSNDVDHHYMRGLTFKENGQNSTFYSAGLSAGYYLTHHAKLFAEASYSRYTNGKADTKIIDDEGFYGYADNGGGLSNKNYTLSIGMQYRF